MGTVPNPAPYALSPEKSENAQLPVISRFAESHQRRAQPGELCTCGRQAITVFVTEKWGETGYCGRTDGGRSGPCPFCGDDRHEFGRCPEYRLRLDGE